MLNVALGPVYRRIESHSHSHTQYTKVLESDVGMGEQKDTQPSMSS